MCSNAFYIDWFGDYRGLRFLGVAASVVAPFLDWRITVNCENCFCVYEENGKCTLDSIEIDINGSCTACVYVDIQEDVLNSLKKQLLESWEE